MRDEDEQAICTFALPNESFAFFRASLSSNCFFCFSSSLNLSCSSLSLPMEFFMPSTRFPKKLISRL